MPAPPMPAPALEPASSDPGPRPEGAAKAEGLREGRLCPAPGLVAVSFGSAPPTASRGSAARKCLLFPGAK